MLFFGITFIVTHVLSVGYVLAGGSWGTPSSFAVANLLMLCPGVVALTLKRLVYGEAVVDPLGIHFRPNRWFVFAWILPPLVMLLALALSLLSPGARYAPQMDGLPADMGSFRAQVLGLGLTPIFSMLTIGLAMGPTVNTIGGLGEELGWRGFLYEELSRLGFWRCSTITGGFWALWHVPLLMEGYVDKSYPVASAFGTLAFAFLAAPLLHIVRLRSRSVVACGVLHGTLGSTRILSTAFVQNAGPWANASVPAALLIVNVALVALGQHRDRDGSGWLG